MGRLRKNETVGKHRALSITFPEELMAEFDEYTNQLGDRLGFRVTYSQAIAYLMKEAKKNAN